MTQKKSESGVDPRVWLAIVIAGLCIAGGSWWFSRPIVELNENHYAATLALYRVCNQRSMEGLQEVEAILASSKPQASESESSLKAIASIIDDAHQGRWERATKYCRQLLEQQVRR